MQLREELKDVANRVELYLKVNRFDAAERLLKTTLAEHGSLANIHNLLGVTYHKQSRFLDAINEFTNAMRINPKFIEASLNLAATFCDVSRYESAKEIFQQLQAQIDPKRKAPELVLGRLGDGHAKLAALYEGNGMIADAIVEYRKALHLHPSMPDVKLNLAKLLMRTGQMDKAQRELEELTTTFAPSAEPSDVSIAYLWLGICHYRQGAAEPAVRNWEIAFERDPSSPLTRSYKEISRRMVLN